MTFKPPHSFPINTATSCQFKWTWSTVFLSVGTSSSCHRCKGWDVSEIMDDFHNHPGKLEDRKKMLEGQWPGNGCEYCRDIEVAGGTSERTAYINDMQVSPPELDVDPTAVKVTPRILEVYFNNVCNQKCVYCSPFFSNLIQKEVEKFGPLENEYDLMGFKEKPGYEERKDKFWIWMDKNSQHLLQFQILGGEPMYQPEFEECLEFFEKRSHPNLNWKIFSNLKHRPSNFQSKIDRISTLIETGKLKSFEIVCSMDCWGPQAEYSRYGVKLDEWEKNFQYLVDNHLVDISVHSTITPVSLPTMAEFYKKIMEWNTYRIEKQGAMGLVDTQIKVVNFGWNIVVTPTHMDPCMLGEHATKFFDDLLAVIPDEDNRKRYLQGFKTKVVKSPVDPIRLHRLANYLDKIDFRRQTNWRELYPWLVDIVNANKPNELVPEVNAILIKND